MKKKEDFCRGSNHFLKSLGLALCLVSFGGSAIYASSLYAQRTMLSIQMNDRTVEDVFEYIEKNSEFIFVYHGSNIDLHRKVNLDIRDQSVEIILDKLFSGTDIEYIINNRQIIVRRDTKKEDLPIASQQTKKVKITGVVKDSHGDPVIGANVVEKGTTNGTISDLDGNFSLDVSAGNVLMVSYVGFQEKEVPVGDKKVLQIVLDEDSKALEEVVVTALGITRSEKALGYATQKFKGDELEKVKGVNIATSLSGRISGMRVYNSTEFGVAPKIKLRGEEPLVVVDGVPTNQAFSDFNQDVIENITVLKGATASALYGSRGGNGAIMITTKKGGDKGFSIEVNTSNMFNAGQLKIPEVQTAYSAGSGGKFDNIDYVWGDKLDIGRVYTQWDPIKKEYREMELTSRGKNNFKNFLEFSMISNTTVSVSSSGKNGSIRTSLSYLYDKNQYPNSHKNKFWYNIGGELKLGNKASVEGSMNFTQESAPNTAGYGYGTGYMYNILLWTGPEYDLRDYKDYWLVPNEKQNWHYTDWYDNPYFEAYEKIKSINNFTTNGSLSFKYEILPWLKLQLRAGGVAYANNNVTRSSVGTISKGRGGWEDGALGYYKEGKKTGFTMNYDFFLLFNKKLSDFSVDGLLGGSLYYTKTKNLEASTKNGLSVPGFYSIKASVESPIVDAETKTKKVNSLFGTLTLGYKDTYYLEATGRNDWSSTLPSNDKSYFYPSVGVSIIPSNIISLPDWIPFWKLRGSWTVSKTDLAIYDLDRAYTIKQNVWDGLNTASYPDYLRGDVKPITNRTWEIGTGIHFLQGHRLKLDVSYFNKLTYNNTISQRISSATGYKSRLMNIDEEYVRRGVEISIDATPVQVRDFSWDVSLNLSTSKRYYAKLDENFSPDNLWTYVGARTDSYSYKGYDKDPDGNYIINTNGLMSRSQYSSLIGYTDPDLEYGLANVFKYKNFTLTLNFDGRIGGKSWSNTEFHMLETGAHPDTDNQWRYDEVVNGKKNYVGEGVKIVSGEVKYDQYGRITSDTRVFAPNDIETSYEDFVRSSHNNPDKLVQKKTFLKLREMSIGYNLPKKFISKLSMNSCYVGFIGQNLFVLTKDFRFSDPDGFEDIEGEDISSPSIRYVGVNLKVEF